MISNEETKLFRNQFKYLQKKIEEYQRIVIYRHISPDFDALGSQMGLYQWIKDNFPNKDVHYVGEPHTTCHPHLFPFPEVLDEEWFKQEHLAITTDVSNLPRVSHDGHLKFAKEVIKIDHHPLPEEEQRFGDYLIVHPERPAAAEIIALFALSRPRKYIFSKTAASYCYIGIAGDTGFFKYKDTDGATLRIAGSLIDLGADQNELSFLMEQKDERQIKILQYCLNNYKISEGGTAYYVITKEAEEELHMTSDEGNLYINMFRGLKGVKCAVSISWKEKEQKYRCSLRSASTIVSPIAVKYNGGGHDYACGCSLKNLEELPGLIADIDALK
jgi:phosphoesterase RecJ-like protein